MLKTIFSILNFAKQKLQVILVALINLYLTIQDCPCTKDQAVADIGRFVPDPSCNMYNKKSSYNCYYHQTAQHCVRSIWPS